MSSPLSDIFLSALRAMSFSDTALFMTDEKRAHILRAIVEAYYCHPTQRQLVFDTSRLWCGYISTFVKGGVKIDHSSGEKVDHFLGS